MKNTVNVGISDMQIVSAPDTIATYALGSCVGICILDKIKQIGGMVHIMLPKNNNLDDINQIYKFADTGITEMVHLLEQKGCVKIRMTAKIAGGAKMFEVKDDGKSSIGNIGERNVIAVKKTLQDLKIRLVAEDTGLNYGRTIFFDCTNGDLTVKSFAKGIKVI
ncbi:chemotaxis protein CheD [Sedimentibacter sp. zth1]|uniref:chemotaxis protein CheD n=1 Tax=Sedimentibacter sp. zth1 TaxID=2816908 RepID=UPI001A91BB6E|nr:chemotaxis protein CheD [Sedimentibacter sp. zth1]QSX07179.1 chemotaxis protein CheD [Sedimentibacter sp. zth1]